MKKTAKPTACWRCGTRAVIVKPIALWSAPLNRTVIIARPTCTHCGAIKPGVIT